MKKRILVLGMDHVIDKLMYFYREMEIRHGIEVSYITSDTFGISERYVHDARITAVRPWRMPFQILRRLVGERPTHVEIYLSRLFPVLLATLQCAVLRIPISVVCRGTDILGWETHGYPRKWVTRLVFRYASLILWKESYMKKTILDNALCQEKKLYEIHNAVPGDLLQTNRFDAQSSAFVFLNSFKKWRNIDCLVRAFRLVKDRYPEATLKLVGSTAKNVSYSPASKEYENKLQYLIDELDLREGIEVIPFSLDAWDRADRALAFVLPSDLVWLNFALLEAMAFGIPPILSDVEGVDRIIENGVSGLSVPIEAESVANAMIYALEHRSEMEAMSEAAQARIQEKFLVEAVTRKIVAEYTRQVWH